VKAVLNALFLFFVIALGAKEPIRTWTSADGRTLEARYLEMVGSKVRIENASGRKFTVPLTGFSSADQEYVRKAYGRALFAEPQPFEDEGRGGVIVASASGKVEVITQKHDRYSDKDPDPRDVIVGESIGPGATLITGSGAEADLLLTNGTLAHLGANTKLVLTALYQKSFQGTKQKASELTKEVSPSRTALKLEEGDLVLEVRKLGKESSFLISTKIAQAGIRGTQFRVSANADSAELSVLEGRVDFLDAEQMATPVETAKKAGTLKGVPAKLEDMSASEQAKVKQAVEQAKGASASIDLNRLADTVDGYEKKPNYIVKSALGMEMIWCPPGGFVMGPSKKGGNNESPEHPVILTRGFFMGKYEVTQEEYKEVMSKNPSIFRGDKLPVEMVSWNEAVAFCETLTKRVNRRGWKFALPTEAEWEYACRAGTTTRFSWGDSFSPQFANYSASGLKKTLNVGSYTPNPWGFHDLHGNVNEWTNDFYNLYPNHLVVDPIQIDQTGIKVYRGGSWKLTDIFMRSSWRDFVLNPPDYRRNKVHDDVGFRVALKQVD
jgi:formylglycine-generating enzyme required for sulfatase activity